MQINCLPHAHSGYDWLELLLVLYWKIVTFDARYGIPLSNKAVHGCEFNNWVEVLRLADVINNHCLPNSVSLINRLVRLQNSNLPRGAALHHCGFHVLFKIENWTNSEPSRDHRSLRVKLLSNDDLNDKGRRLLCVVCMEVDEFLIIRF